MSMKYQYTVKLACDDGYLASIDLLVQRKEDLTILQRFLAFGKDIGESVHIEPEPYGRVDDLRNLLTAGDQI